MTARAVLRWVEAMGRITLQVGLVIVIHVLGREAGTWEHTAVTTDPILADVATWLAFVAGCVLAAVWVIGTERYLRLGEALDAAADEIEDLRAELGQAHAYGRTWETWAADEADDTEPRGRHLASVPDTEVVPAADVTLVRGPA